MKNAFEEKMHQIKIERELLLNILHSAGITNIEDKAIETLKNVDMKQLIIKNLRSSDHLQSESKSKAHYKKLKLVSAL